MRSLPALVALVVAGCPKAGREVEAEASAVVTALDAIWRDRDARGLDSVEGVTELASYVELGEPEVLWRIARLEVSRGLVAVDPVEARRSYARARAAAERCLGGETGGVLGALREGRPRPLEGARMRCSAWGGYAWVRLLTTLDPAAASVDFPVVSRWLDAAASEGAAPHVTWARALLDLIRPAHLGGHPDAAREHAARLALRDVWDAWVRYRDIRWLAPDADVRPPSRAPASPEERAAAESVVSR